jgi:hypothetical protein
MAKTGSKLLVGLGIFAVLFTVITVIILNFFPTILNLVFRDIAPINDSDLQLKTITTEKKDNAYYDLIKIEKSLKGSSKDFELVVDHLDGKTWDKNFVDKLLSKNREALGYFDSAYQEPKFQDPIYADPKTVSVEDVISVQPQSLIKAAQTNSLKALNLAKEGKDQESLDQAIKAAEIGQKIQDSNGTLIHYLVGSSMKKIGLQTVHILLISSKLQSNMLTSYAASIGKYQQKNKSSFETALKMEYQFYSAALNRVSTGEGSNVENSVPNIDGFDLNFLKSNRARSNYYFQPNKTKAIFADYVRSAIKDSKKPCGLVQAKEVATLVPTQKILLLFTENAVGKILHDIMVIGLDKVINKRCDDDLLVSATQLLFALKAYKVDTGSLPSSLGELTPKYISEIPPDPFDGKDLKYSQEKKIIYSVGADNIDSGGSEGEDWCKMKDPTFKIDF